MEKLAKLGVVFFWGRWSFDPKTCKLHLNGIKSFNLSRVMAANFSFISNAKVV